MPAGHRRSAARGQRRLGLSGAPSRNLAMRALFVALIIILAPSLVEADESIADESIEPFDPSIHKSLALFQHEVVLENGVRRFVNLGMQGPGVTRTVAAWCDELQMAEAYCANVTAAVNNVVFQEQSRIALANFRQAKKLQGGSTSELAVAVVLFNDTMYFTRGIPFSYNSTPSTNAEDFFRSREIPFQLNSRKLKRMYESGAVGRIEVSIRIAFASRKNEPFRFHSSHA